MKDATRSGRPEGVILRRCECGGMIPPGEKNVQNCFTDELTLGATSSLVIRIFFVSFVYKKHIQGFFFGWCPS